MYQVESSQTILHSKVNIWKSIPRFMGSTVFVLGLTSLLTDVSSEMISTILPAYLVLSLHISPLQFGIIDGLYQGASTLVRLLSGYFSDRFQKPKELATAGYIFSALNKVGFLLGGTTFVSIGVLVLLDRIGKGVRTPPRDAMIAAASSDDTLATSFGIHRAMDTIGAMVGPLLAAIILGYFVGAYQLVFAVSMGFAVLGVMVIAFFVPTKPKVKIDRAQLSGNVVTKIFRIPNVAVLVVGSSLLALVTISDNFVYLALQQRFTVPIALFPLFYVIVAAIFMLTAIPVGKLADRIGRTKIFIWGNIILASSYGALQIPHAPNALLFLVLAAMGVYYAATDGVLPAMMSRVLPKEMKATGLALSATGVGVAKLVSSVAFGYVWNAYGRDTAITTFFTGFVCMLIGCIYYVRRLNMSH